jgi:hypothetical protein
MGKKYFERFGFLYEPSYHSLFCDNEFTDISVRLNKVFYYDKVLIQHRHPMNVRGVPVDTLYRRNDAYFKIDQATYLRRKTMITA